MSENNPMQPVETTGTTVEEAIEAGLAVLGLTRNDVIIEVVEEGARGMLGLGSRDARVRLAPLRAPAPPFTPSTASTPEPSAAPSEPKSRPAAAPQVVPDDKEAETAVAVLQDLLTLMSIDAQIAVNRADASDSDEGEAPWVLDIQGRDLGVLIGRHGETLDALQYIARLIISRELQARANIVLDVEGYKTRREVALHKLAHNMAAQAREMGRTMNLEPMPPNERRIIHIALRDDDTVTTESVGTGDQRRVTIIPRQNN
jgi:spoIIIJ-associated protein